MLPGPRQCPLQIRSRFLEFPPGRVRNTGHPDAGIAQFHPPVFQHPDPLFRKKLSPPGVVIIILMVAGYRKNAQRSPQVPQRLQIAAHFLHCPIQIIADQQDHIRLGGIGKLHKFPHPFLPHRGTGMNIA